MSGSEEGFGELYDEPTRRAIDRWAPGEGAEPLVTTSGAGGVVGGWRGGAVAGAVVAAGLVGVRDALEDGEEPEVAEIRPDDGWLVDEAVTVLFVPGDPEATVAVVRPWLLRHRPGPAITALAG